MLKSQFATAQWSEIWKTKRRSNIIKSRLSTIRHQLSSEDNLSPNLTPKMANNVSMLLHFITYLQKVKHSLLQTQSEAKV